MKFHIILENVSKILGGREVLNNISFKLPAGKTLAIIGHSGSGKSTLLKTINRLTEIDSGSIFINGKSIHGADPINLRRKVGFVSQKPEMFEGKVYHNLRYALDLQNKYDKKTVLNALYDAELDASFLYRDTAKLSGGEQQRVAIARSLTLQPEILLLDEPTAALDVKITRRFETTIKHLKKSRNITIIWVTHNLAQAKRVGDLIGILKKGKLVKLGKPFEIFNNSMKGNLKKRRMRNHKGGGA